MSASSRSPLHETTCHLIRIIGARELEHLARGELCERRSSPINSRIIPIQFVHHYSNGRPQTGLGAAVQSLGSSFGKSERAGRYARPVAMCWRRRSHAGTRVVAAWTVLVSEQLKTMIDWLN